MGSKPDAWMPLYIGAYLGDTMRLTTEQHGAYLLILMDYWRNGPPPDDDATLAAIARMPLPSWRRARAVLADFFHVEDGRWRQKRADEEMAKAQRLVEQKSVAGKASAEAKKQRKAQRNGNGNSTPVAQPLPTADPTDDQRRVKPSPLPSPSSLREEPRAREVETKPETPAKPDDDQMLRDLGDAVDDLPDSAKVLVSSFTRRLVSGGIELTSAQKFTLRDLHAEHQPAIRKAQSRLIEERHPDLRRAMDSPSGQPIAAAVLARDFATVDRLMTEWRGMEIPSYLKRTA